MVRVWGIWLGGMALKVPHARAASRGRASRREQVKTYTRTSIETYTHSSRDLHSGQKAKEVIIMTPKHATAVAQLCDALPKMSLISTGSILNAHIHRDQTELITKPVQEEQEEQVSDILARHMPRWCGGMAWAWFVSGDKSRLSWR